MVERKKKSTQTKTVRGVAPSPARSASGSGTVARTSLKANAGRHDAAERRSHASATRNKSVRTDHRPPAVEVGDWREDTLARLRALIFEAVPDMIEERKWIKPTNPAGVAAWSRNGLVATGEKYKGVAKITFARGASLPDPAKLFNAGLEGGTRRAIDIREGETVDARAFKALVKAAVAYNDRPK